MSEAKVTRTMTLRVTDEDLAKLDGLCARMPIVPRSRLARECLRLGLAALAADPTRLLRPAEDGKGNGETQPAPASSSGDWL